MDRPSGRKKTVSSSGGGNARRRGGGLGIGPVGSTGGFGRRDGNGSSGRSGQRSGGRAVRASGGLKKLITIAVVLLIIVYAFNMCSQEEGASPLSGLLNPEQSGISGEVAESNGTAGNLNSSAYPVDTSVSSKARSRYTALQGNGNDTVTVMVYMCATDLEAEYGMATADLNEMLYADISDQVNVIVQTGGAEKWQNSTISSKTNQRYKVDAESLTLLEKDLGKKSMVKPDTLSSFIRYSAQNYPADRYMLILWDHGGGSISGYGYDQHFTGDSMTLDEIGKALTDGGVQFDVIGFDACLMATLETALVLEPHADYMIASEEVEPGVGWYYTDWLTALSRNTSISTPELGKLLIDSYTSTCAKQARGSATTLSLIDLAELSGTVPNAFAAFAGSMSSMIDNNGYDAVSDARTGAREFASGINQVDLIHFANNLNTEEAKALADALRGCIKYNRTAGINNANGISVYFPHNSIAKVGSALNTYEKFGMDEEYTACIRSFASMTVGGHAAASGSSGNLLGTLLQAGAGMLTESLAPSSSSSGLDAADLLELFLSGDSSIFSGSGISGLGDVIDISDIASWLDTDRVRRSADYFAANQFDTNALGITEKNGKPVLALTEEQWNDVRFMEQSVFLNDGEGFIDLGLDNVYEYNEDGDLLMEYDGTWLSLNGQIVSYYMETNDHAEGSCRITGYVPAYLNGTQVEILLSFTDELPEGTVLGARLVYDEAAQTDTAAKGLIQIKAGDRIDYLCDYYTYDGAYSDTYYLGEPYTATGSWEINNAPVGDMPYSMTYRITDVYGNRYWTQAVTG